MFLSISINGNDTTTIAGNSQVNALGSLSMISTGDLDIGVAGHQRNATEGQLIFAVGDEVKLITGGNHSLSIGKNETKEITENLSETIGNLRKSIAKQQQLTANKTWIGSDKINALQLLSQTLAIMQTMANLLANHTHPGDSGGSTGRPYQAENFNKNAS